MGEHHARSSATAGRIAGRSALTAATAIALTGGTASFAFAAQAPSVDHTAQATQTAVSSLAASAQALPSTPAPTSAAGVEKLLGDHEADVEHKVADIAGPAAEDTQHALNANGVPVGNRVTDTEHEIVNRSGAVSEQVHHATGSAAASLDARSAPTRPRPGTPPRARPPRPGTRPARPSTRPPPPPPRPSTRPPPPRPVPPPPFRACCPSPDGSRSTLRLPSVTGPRSSPPRGGGPGPVVSLARRPSSPRPLPHRRAGGCGPRGRRWESPDRRRSCWRSRTR